MKYIIFLSLLILSFSSQAAPTCSRNGTTVIYTNGVTTKKLDARRALVAIIGLGLNSNIDLKTVNYDLGYNYEESVARDFLEAAVQRIPNIYLTKIGVTNPYAAFSSFYFGVGLGLIPFQAYLTLLEALSDDFAQSVNNYLVTQKNNPKYIQTFNEIKKLYTDAFDRGERVFAISHSQGGLFMRDVYNSLEENSNKRRFFSGFQIASPLPSKMDSHFGYATHGKDNLINLVRETVGALPANITAPSDLRNGLSTAPSQQDQMKDFVIEYFLNHGILTTYLYNPEIKSKVESKLIIAAEKLESNCVKAIINYTKDDLQVNFDSTNPNRPDVDGLTYFWNFDDGQKLKTTEKKISHNYLSPGTYTARLKVVDAFGFFDMTNVTFQVGPNPPVAIINYTKNNLQVNFESIGNTNLTGLSYFWNFGNGSTVRSNSKTSAITYSQEGTYVVTLIVTNAYGVSVSTSVSVQVTAPFVPPVIPPVVPPPATPTSIYYTKQDLRVDLRAEGDFYNPSLPSAARFFNWNFGDGTFETSIGSSIYHVYASSGTYTVTVDVVDIEGISVAEKGSVDVFVYRPVAKILSSPGSSVVPGSSFTYKIKCDVDETVFMETNVSYDFISYDFINSKDYIPSCTGLEVAGISGTSNESTHEITCQTNTFQSTNFYAMLVANHIKTLYATNPDQCEYKLNLSITPRFWCGVINQATGERYYSNSVDAAPFLLSAREETSCD